MNSFTKYLLNDKMIYERGLRYLYQTIMAVIVEHSIEYNPTRKT